MQHKGTVLIESDRLILREFCLEDSEAVFRNWKSDDKVTEFLQWPTNKTIEETRETIKTWVDSYAESNFYCWAIVLKDGKDESIGIISVVDQNEEIDMMHIGYCIGSRWWNQGIISEAFSAIIPFLFEQVKANRIESQHDPNNQNSGKVMIKFGLKYEGTLRQADINNKGVVDAAMYSLLASEYYAK